MCWSQLEAIGLFCWDADENEGVFPVHELRENELQKTF
jgi:hypothetical protein